MDSWLRNLASGVPAPRALAILRRGAGAWICEQALGGIYLLMHVSFGQFIALYIVFMEPLRARPGARLAVPSMPEPRGAVLIPD